jgi:hypothetical protein
MAGLKLRPTMLELLAGYAAFLDYRYWLNPHPVPLGSSLVGAIFAFFGWFIIATVALRVVAYSLRLKDALKADVFTRFASLLSWTGIIGLVLLFFSYEQIPLLGMRLWFLALFLAFVVWLLRIALYVVRDYPKLRQTQTERARFEKYLPKRG